MIFSQPGFPPDLGTERGTKQPGFFFPSPNKKAALNQPVGSARCCLALRQPVNAQPAAIQKPAFFPNPTKSVFLTLFTVIKLPGPQLNNAGRAQLPLVAAFDKYLNSLFTPFFANLTFHEDLL